MSQSMQKRAYKRNRDGRFAESGPARPPKPAQQVSTLPVSTPKRPASKAPPPLAPRLKRPVGDAYARWKEQQPHMPPALSPEGYQTSPSRPNSQNPGQRFVHNCGQCGQYYSTQTPHVCPKTIKTVPHKVKKPKYFASQLSNRAATIAPVAGVGMGGVLALSGNPMIAGVLVVAGLASSIFLSYNKRNKA